MSTEQAKARIAVVGGGVAGSTVALKLADLGLDVTLFERGGSLVNGPPVCHLHAGGSLYRELSDQHCKQLLLQSIETYRAFPQCVKKRPTVIAVPVRDGGDPLSLLPRLELLQNYYRELIALDPANEVLGSADDYYRLFDYETLQALADQPLPENPQTPEEWMIPVARKVALEKLCYPLVMVQEYGVSVFRLAALFSMALNEMTNVRVKTGCDVTDAQEFDAGWQLQYCCDNGGLTSERFDYLINACGFRSGRLDDLVGSERQRMAEFKAAYLAQWPQCSGVWPELVFHGTRGTSEGMAQFTPYADNLFQLHGMTENITLFPGGLARTAFGSSQPQLPLSLVSKIEQGWSPQTVDERTRAAIAHLAYFIPDFASAEVGGKPLFGAQQIPGGDPALRNSGASFARHRYARSEIVKLSSALDAATEIARAMHDEGLLEEPVVTGLHATSGYHSDEVIKRAEMLAVERRYPGALAR